MSQKEKQNRKEKYTRDRERGGGCSWWLLALDSCSRQDGWMFARDGDGENSAPYIYPSVCCSGVLFAGLVFQTRKFVPGDGEKSRIFYLSVACYRREC